MSHPAAPPGSACLPLGRRLHPINTLKRWPVVLSNRNLHRLPSAPTQAGAPLIFQRVRYFYSGFSLELCVCWISCSTIPADICYLPAKQLHEDHGAGEPISIASQISAPIGCADDGLDGSALSVSASFDVAGHLALYGNGHLACLGAGRGLAFVGL